MRFNQAEKYEIIRLVEDSEIGPIRNDGQLEFLGQVFKAVSYAALAGIQDAGSHRQTVNGWNVWKYRGRSIRTLREEFLKNEADEE